MRKEHILSQASLTDSSIPRPEHPRPDFQREPWLNLNGRWRFTFDPQNVGEQKKWYRMPHPTVGTSVSLPIADPFQDEIVVPFPWESRLSHVGATDYKGAAWYQRVIEVPADWAEEDAVSGPRDARGLPSAEDTAAATTGVGANVIWRRKPYLCFGAVDWHARVWINGRFAGEHSGGYTPFDLDLSHYVRPGQPATLTARAWDACDADTPLGKQTENWYTHSGGIWQTVWLEGRAAAHLSHLHVTPHLEAGTATFAMRIVADDRASGSRFRLSVVSADGAFPAVERTVSVSASTTEHELEVTVPNPRPWSPEDPHLYDCTVKLVAESGADGDGDAVSTYFGLRSVSRGFWDGNPFEYVFLNGEPVFLRGALDQAFNPDGLHTYASDDAIRADIQAAKDLGLNMLCCHIKVNEPRYYYWADRLGLLVMYDLPSASVYTPSARANWEQTFRASLERDFSHPSIFAWILFNETWGLEEHQTPASWSWVKQMYDLAKELDPSRLVEDNSVCLYDHVTTDINTWHFYIADYDRARRHVERVVAQTQEGSAFNYVGHRYGHVEGSAAYRQGTEPLLNSEYAGLGARGGDKDISYTFKFLTTELRRHPKICGYIYTELTDIEWEHNGLVNYDRSAKEFGYDAFLPGMTVADLNRADFVGLDCPPCQTLAPGAAFTAPAFVSHWDQRPLRGAHLCWRISATDRFGRQRVVFEDRRPIEPRRFGVTDAGAIETRLPDEPCLLTVALWLQEGDGSICARNYVNVDVHGGTPPPNVERTASGYALRFRPGEFLDSSWPTPTLAPRGQKFGAAGAGWVEYAVPLPEGLDAGAVNGMRLVFEGAARTASGRLGWVRPWQAADTNYPQTEAHKLSTTVAVCINGIELGTTRLPDDPADARGVLSAHLNENFEYASHGFLTTLEADADTAHRILEASSNRELVVRFEVPRSGRSGGLNLYGARMGAFPIDPTLFLDVEA
jgi:hypothetical protein